MPSQSSLPTEEKVVAMLEFFDKGYLELAKSLVDLLTIFKREDVLREVLDCFMSAAHFQLCPTYDAKDAAMAQIYKTPPNPENWVRVWHGIRRPAGSTRFYIWVNRMPGKIFVMRPWYREATITVSDNPIPNPAVGDTQQFPVKERVNHIWYFFNNTNHTRLNLPAAMYATGGFIRVTWTR